VPDERDDLIVFGRERAFVRAEHECHTGAVEVAVAQADRCAGRCQGNGKIRRDGGLSHAAFAAGHGDNVLNSRDDCLADRSCSGRGGGWLLNIKVNLGGADALDLAQCGSDLAMHLLGNGCITCRDLNFHSNLTGGNVNALHEAERYDIATVAGVFYGSQGLADGVFINHGCVQE
jgi:hypothetical protein